MKILIAEDEQDIANSLIKNFKEEGHETLHAINGEEAIEFISKNEFDVILLRLENAEIKWN